MATGSSSSTGDKAHLQTNQIIDKLDQLSSEMKKSGCFPNTEFVLQDVEEHSEKLAVALGLLNTPPGVCMAELGLEDTSIQRMNLLLRDSKSANFHRRPARLNSHHILLNT
ncbi:pentatricopeptide repeat-containing protein At1g20230-like [Malus sylvestris]|uniref:pentatricopeptide repeat-containing protein At1g20230-like n=1 Tax=Malus sylvestris TaxID=3752 RepID=UPI0021AD26DF|nr:pentatricopeptide repeat-containing protein At1g20230-like [Malus sylvestris]